MARRQLELGAAVGIWQARGGSLTMLTFTMRHHEGQRLADLWSALSAAWNRVVGGTQWLKDRDRFGIAGWLRVVEVTWGRHGWHVHVHALLFTEAVPPVADLQRRLFARWARALVRMGLDAPLAVGQDAHLVTGPADQGIADYLVKAVDARWSVGRELTSTQSKGARQAYSTRSTWSLLDDVEDLGDVTVWHEWEQASKGRRQLTWSQGLRELLGMRREQADEDIAAEEVGSSGDDLVFLTADGWDQLCRVPADLGLLLDCAEGGGAAAVRAFLDSRDVSYLVLEGEVS